MVSGLIGTADNVVGRTLLPVKSVMRLWTEGINVARRASRLHSVSRSPTHGLEKRATRTERRASAQKFFAVRRFIFDLTVARDRTLSPSGK
jgi:hypothetical protein